MVETEPGTFYTSPFFLLATVLSGPKLASRKKSFQGNTCDTGKSRLSPETAPGYNAWPLKSRIRPVIAQKYTGKEHEDLTRLTYFGARWYDPELATWLSPDAVDVYANPYVFGGGKAGADPLSYVDPDGNCPICVVLVIAAIGAYAGASKANHSIDPTKWDYSSGSTYGYMAGGAVIGAASAVTGGYVGGAVLAGMGGAAAGAGATLAAGMAGGAVGSLVSGVGNYSLDAAYGNANFSGTGLLRVASVSPATGAIGGAAGSGFTSLVGTVNIGSYQIASPVVRGMITGAMGGAAAGYATGFGGTLIAGGSLAQANRGGLSGLYIGAVGGGIGGGISGYASAQRSGINPWTGRSLEKSRDISGFSSHSDFLKQTKLLPADLKDPSSALQPAQVRDLGVSPQQWQTHLDYYDYLNTFTPATNAAPRIDRINEYLRALGEGGSY